MEDDLKPSVKEKDWIHFGEGVLPKLAVVVTVYPNNKFGADIEVVYLDGGRAIAEDMVWESGKWKFLNPGPGGTYADNSSRFNEYISILRAGYKYHN